MNTQVNDRPALEQTGTQQANKQATAVLFDANTRERFNPTVRDELVSFIRVQMRSGEGIHKKLFGYVRQCGDYSTATGTIHGAEKQVCKDEKVKNLNQLNKARDMALASYLTVKSAILSTMETADDLCEAQQALYNWLEEHEGAPKTIIAKGYLDAWSDRYADPVKGASQFRKDSQEAKAAATTLEQKKAAWQRIKDREAQKAAEQTAATGTVEATPAQVRSGGGISDVKLPEDWTTALNNLKSTLAKIGTKDNRPFQVSEFGKKVPGCLERAEQAIAQLYKDYFESIKVLASEHAARPSEAVAATQRTESEPESASATGQEPELPEVVDEITEDDEKWIAENAPDGTEPAASPNVGTGS